VGGERESVVQRRNSANALRLGGCTMFPGVESEPVRVEMTRHRHKVRSNHVGRTLETGCSYE
jgi:hypothetical protein